MAVQLSHPQGAYDCGYCPFASSDHRILVRHLLGHCGFRERHHEHILWCALCRPSCTDSNRIDGYRQAMINETHLSGNDYRDNDMVYGDTSNYYQGFNAPYNPYAFSNPFYYPMNITYRNPCYGYYQTHNTIFYSDDFYEGNDVYKTPLFIEYMPENKHLLDVPPNSENTPNSFAKSLNNTLSGLDSNDSGTEALPIDLENFSVNSLKESSYQVFSVNETVISESVTNAELSIVQTNTFGNISNIELLPEVNNTQPTSGKTLSRKSTLTENLTSNEMRDPKLTAVKSNPFQTYVREGNCSETVSNNLTESSNLEFSSQTVSKDVSSIRNTNSSFKANPTNMNADGALNVLNKGCYSKLPVEKLAELSEIDANTNESSKELAPVSFSEAACIEKTVVNNALDIKNFSLENDNLSQTALTKECCNSSEQQTSAEEASSENLLGKSSIRTHDLNSIPITEAELYPGVNSTILTEDALNSETGPVNIKDPLTEIDLNEIHSELSTGKLETQSTTLISKSDFSGNGTLVSAGKVSSNPVILRKNRASDDQIQPNSMNDYRRIKKDKVFSNKKAASFERRSITATHEDTLNRNSHRKSKDNCVGSIAEGSKSRSDKAGAPSEISNCSRNNCRSDLNSTNKNSGAVQNRATLTYSEVLKRGL